MATPTMIETTTHPRPEEERFQLLDQLKVIDTDADKLRRFLEDQYINQLNDQHPDIFYSAALRLTSLTHLESRDEKGAVELPPQQEAMRAFTSYARLITMINDERHSPRYTGDGTVNRRLSGIREELAFHAALTYLSADGLDVVTLPTPARHDFNGGRRASDLQLYLAGSEQPLIDIQIKTSSKTANNQYHPRIPVLSLKDVLGGAGAIDLRGLLRSIGERDGHEGDPSTLPPNEHHTILSAGTKILISASQWIDEYDVRMSATSEVA